MSGEAQFLVGRPVEITRDEASQLRNLSKEMASLANRQNVGWLLPWMQAHRACHLILKRVFERAHDGTPHPHDLKFGQQGDLFEK